MVTLPPSVQNPGYNFSVALDRFEAKTVGKLDIVLRKVALDLLSSVVAGIPWGVGTPVDTGRARGGWQVGIDNDPMGDTGRLDPNGSLTIAEGNSTIGQATNESTIYISNNVEYIVPLEYGHSKQAPFGMVRVALSAFSPIVERAAAAAVAEGEMMGGGTAA